MYGQALFHPQYNKSSFPSPKKIIFNFPSQDIQLFSSSCKMNKTCFRDNLLLVLTNCLLCFMSINSHFSFHISVSVSPLSWHPNKLPFYTNLGSPRLTKSASFVSNIFYVYFFLLLSRNVTFICVSF